MSQTLGLSIGLVLSLALPAWANPPNQSDITGTNVFNSIAPEFESYGFDAATLAQARSLSEALNTAYGACVASVDAARGLPRRFALGPASNAPCITAACEDYERWLAETRAFLSQLGVEPESVPARVW
jgi:hypothetical protein